MRLPRAYAETSASPNPILRAAALVRHSQNMQRIGIHSVHDIKRVSMNDHTPGVALCGCAHGRVLT